MSVQSNELVIYTANNMPEDNTSTVGGDINSGIRASFDDPSSAVQIVTYSSSASDTGTLSLTGRSTAGLIISDTISLSGTTKISSSNTYERILKAELSKVCDGIVTVSGTSINKITDVPIGESGFRRPFYDATSQVGVAKTYYEKLFVQNRNPTLALSNAKVIEVSTGFSSKITFALEDSKQSNQTITDRGAVPTGVTGGFGDGPSGIVSDELTATDYQGIWLKMSLDADEDSTNSFYEVQISGTTV